MAAAHNVFGLFGRRSDYGEQRDARELRAFFHEYEASIGFKSTFSAMLAAASGVALGVGSPTSWDPYAEIIERISRGRHVFRSLCAIGNWHSTVLFLLYGPTHGVVGAGDFGDLAPLVPYTQVAQDARDDLVLRRSTLSEEDVGDRVELGAHTRRAEIEEMFWREAALAALLERRIATAKKIQSALDGPPTDFQAKRLAKLPEHERRLAVSRPLLEKLLDAYLSNGTLRARLGAITAVDRAVSVEEAIREQLDVKRPLSDRSIFTVTAKKQAERIRCSSHDAYRLARNATATGGTMHGPVYDRENRCWVWP